SSGRRRRPPEPSRSATRPRPLSGVAASRVSVAFPGGVLLAVSVELFAAARGPRAASWRRRHGRSVAAAAGGTSRPPAAPGALLATEGPGTSRTGPRAAPGALLAAKGGNLQGKAAHRSGGA